jgi:hypothetical protein
MSVTPEYAQARFAEVTGDPLPRIPAFLPRRRSQSPQNRVPDLPDDTREVDGDYLQAFPGEQIGVGPIVVGTAKS